MVESVRKSDVMLPVLLLQSATSVPVWTIEASKTEPSKDRSVSIGKLLQISPSMLTSSRMQYVHDNVVSSSTISCDTV